MLQLNFIRENKKDVISGLKKRGFNTIMRGYQILMLRRGVDWGFRYYGMTSTINYLTNNTRFQRS